MSARLDTASIPFIDPAAPCTGFESVTPTGKLCVECGAPIMVKKSDGAPPEYFDLNGHRFAPNTQKL